MLKKIFITGFLGLVLIFNYSVAKDRNYNDRNVNENNRYYQEPREPYEMYHDGFIRDKNDDPCDSFYSCLDGCPTVGNAKCIRKCEKLFPCDE